MVIILTINGKKTQESIIKMPSKASVRCKTTNTYPEWAVLRYFTIKYTAFVICSLVLIVSNRYAVPNTWVALSNF